MKTITRSNIYLPMAAMILTAVAIPAAAQQQVPFMGTFQGTDRVTLPTITTNATGVGAHVGQFSLSEVVTLNSPSGDGTGTGHWIAANRDSVDSTFVASADMSTHSLGYITVTEIHTITGGTGRFAAAQGSFKLERTHIVDPSADGTNVTFGSFHGSITPPGAAH